jgi:putative GTP pyrophosphokinase
VAELGDRYEARCELLEVARANLEVQTKRAFGDVEHIDRVSFRVKGRLSFLKKVEKASAARRPDHTPRKEIEYKIAGRIIVFFLDDVAPAIERLKEVFAPPVESMPRAPQLDAEFGYESFHEVYSIPGWALAAGWRERDDLPETFELQVRTLFQHAYAEPQHDVAYKPTTPLTPEERRELAWVAASAWGSDQALVRVRRQIDSRTD